MQAETFLMITIGWVRLEELLSPHILGICLEPLKQMEWFVYNTKHEHAGHYTNTLQVRIVSAIEGRNN